MERIDCHEALDFSDDELAFSIDWTEWESVRAKLRVLVKRILRKHGYSPDKQEKAIQTVIEQAELIGKEWAA
jgi:type I restriction enzyme, R subunit